MILEWKNNQGVFSLIQQKDGSGVCSSDKSKGKEKGDKPPVAVNGGQNVDKEATTQLKNADETQHVPSHAGVTKPGPALAVEKTNPSMLPDLGKCTYNPITHAPSTTE